VFTWCGGESEQKPQCDLYYEVLSNECTKSAKLRRHLETEHCDVTNKPNEFFQRRLGILNYGKDIVSAMGSFNLEKMSERYDNANNHASSTRCDAKSELSSFTNNKTCC
jgi:hypothetical protein